MSAMNDYSPHDFLVRPGAARITRAVLKSWLDREHVVGPSGDGGFSDDGESAAQPATVKPLREAAVLILVVDRPQGATVLFTQRTAHLTDHAGQISFPGGRVEADDRDAAHTALREAEEETGVDASRIEILGAIPQYTTGTGYLVTPVVAWTAPPIEYRPDPTEVAECFEVPFDFLVDGANHRLESAMYKGRMRSYFAIPYGSRYIWGATAGMLVTLTRVLAAAQGLESLPAVRMAPDSG